MFIAATLAGLLAGASLIIAIGAQNAFVLRQGLQQRQVGLVVATCTLADISLIICGVAGIGALVQRWPEMLQALRYGGAAFLGGYALVAARRAWHGSDAMAPMSGKPPERRQVLLTCLALTLLNPHVYLDTMLLLGSLSTRYPGTARWGFALGACMASVLWFCALGYGARLLQPLFRKRAAWRVLDTSMAAFMLCLCLLLLLRPLG